MQGPSQLSREQQQALALAQAKRKRAEAEAQTPAAKAPPASMAPVAKAPPMASNGAGMGSVNPMVEMGLNAQRQALIGEAERYRQGKIDQVQAQRRPFVEEPVDVQQVIAGMDKSLAMREPATPESAMKSLFSHSNTGGAMGLGGGPAIGIDPAPPVISTKPQRTAPLAVWNGLVQGTQSGINLFPDVANFLMDVGGETKSPNRVPTADLSRARMDIAPEDQSIPTALLEGLVQFIAARRVVGNAMPGGGIAPQIGKDALAVGVGFDGSTGRVADMIDPSIIPEGPLRDYAQFLRTQPEDSPLVGRFKNMLEDMTFSGPAVVPQAVVAPAMRGAANLVNPPAIPTNAGGARLGPINTAAVPPATAVPPTRPAPAPVQPQPAAQAAPQPPAPVQTATAPPIPPQPPVGGPPVAAGAAGNPPGVPVAQAAQTPPPGTLTPVPQLGEAEVWLNNLDRPTREAVMRTFESSGVPSKNTLLGKTWSDEQLAIIRDLNVIPDGRNSQNAFLASQKWDWKYPSLRENLSNIGGGFAVTSPRAPDQKILGLFGGKADKAQSIMDTQGRKQVVSERGFLERSAATNFGAPSDEVAQQLKNELQGLGSRYNFLLSPTKKRKFGTDKLVKLEENEAELKKFLQQPWVVRSMPPQVRDRLMVDASEELRNLGWTADELKQMAGPTRKKLAPLFEASGPLEWSPQMWEEIAKQYPRFAAHVLQSSYAKAARGLASGMDAANNAGTIGNLNRMRGIDKDGNVIPGSLLDRLEKTMPNADFSFTGAGSYADTRRNWGDIKGAQEAFDVTRRFKAAAQSGTDVASIIDEMDNLSPRGKEAAFSEISSFINDSMGNKVSNLTPGQAGTGAVTAPNLTQIGNDNFLRALRKVFGKPGDNLANDIELARSSTTFNTDINRRINSRTETNAQAVKESPKLYENAAGIEDGIIDNNVKLLGGGAGLLAVTNPGAIPLLAIPPAVNMAWNAFKRGKRLTNSQRNQLADFWFRSREAGVNPEELLNKPPGGRGPSMGDYAGAMARDAAIGAGVGYGASGGDPEAAALGAAGGAAFGVGRARVRNARSIIKPPPAGPRGGNRLRTGGNPPPAVGPRGARTLPGQTSPASATVTGALVGGGLGYVGSDGDPTATLAGAVGGGAVGGGAAFGGAARLAKGKPRPAGNALKSGPRKSFTPEQRRAWQAEKGPVDDTPLYRGTTASEADQFKPSEYGMSGRGVYLTSDPRSAKEYATPEGRVVTAYVRGKIAGPSEIKQADAAIDQSLTGMDRVNARHDWLAKRGYTGAKQNWNSRDETIIFDPNDILPAEARQSSALKSGPAKAPPANVTALPKSDKANSSDLQKALQAYIDKPRTKWDDALEQGKINRAEYDWYSGGGTAEELQKTKANMLETLKTAEGYPADRVWEVYSKDPSAKMALELLAADGNQRAMAIRYEAERMRAIPRQTKRMWAIMGEPQVSVAPLADLAGAIGDDVAIETAKSFARMSEQPFLVARAKAIKTADEAYALLRDAHKLINGKDGRPAWAERLIRDARNNEGKFTPPKAKATPKADVVPFGAAQKAPPASPPKKPSGAPKPPPVQNGFIGGGRADPAKAEIDKLRYIKDDASLDTTAGKVSFQWEVSRRNGVQGPDKKVWKLDGQRIGFDALTKKIKEAHASGPTQNGFGGSKLPMDEASRMQRMQEQGYQRDWWHSGAMADEFDPAGGELGLHIGTKSAAEGAARQAWRQRRLGARSDAPASAKPIEPRELAVRGKFATTPDVEDFGDPFDYLKARNSTSTEGWWDSSYSKMWDELDGAARAAHKANDRAAWREAVHAAAKKNGIDGWQYHNEFEGGQSRVVFSPDVTRDVNAAFDPAQSSSSKLLNGFADKATYASAGGGIAYGELGPLEDLNNDGVKDEKDRAAMRIKYGMGGIMTPLFVRGGVGMAKSLGNKLKGGKAPPMGKAPPAQSGFGGGNGPKAPPKVILEKRVANRLGKMAPALSEKTRDAIRANAGLPPAMRKSAYEASGYDPALIEVAAPFMTGRAKDVRGKAGPAMPKPKNRLTSLDRGVHSARANAARAPDYPPLDSAAELRYRTENARRGAKSSVTRWENDNYDFDREAAGLPQRKAPADRRQRLERQAETAALADRMLKQMKPTADDVEWLQRKATRRLREIDDAIQRGQMLPDFATAKPRTQAEAKDMARMIFEAEYADLLDDVLSGRVTPKARSEHALAVFLASSASIGAVGGAMTLADINSAADRQRQARDAAKAAKEEDMSIYREPTDPRFVWDWEKIKKTRRAAQTIQANLNALPPNKSDGRFNLTIDAWGPKTEAAVKRWQFENGSKPTGELTKEQWDLLDQQATEARQATR